MTSPENQQPITPENKQAEALSRLEVERADGVSYYKMDANKESPSLNARINSDQEDTKSAVVTESAWGLSRGALFADEKLDVAMFASDEPAAIERRLRKDMKNGSADAILIQTAEGYVYRSNPNDENSSTAIAVLNEQKGNRLLGESENYEKPVGRYIPRKDDLIVITDKQRAEAIAALPASEAESSMFDTEGEDEQPSFIAIETPLRLSKNMFEAKKISDTNNLKSRAKASGERPARRQKAAQAAETAAPEAPERVAPWANNTAEDADQERVEQQAEPVFKVDQDVIVIRKNGDQVHATIDEIADKEGAPYAHVCYEDASGTLLHKWVRLETLQDWQKTSAQEKESAAPKPSDMPKKLANQDPTERMSKSEAIEASKQAEESLSENERRLKSFSAKLSEYEDLAMNQIAKRRKGKLLGSRGDDERTIELPAKNADGTPMLASYNELVQKIEHLTFGRDMAQTRVWAEQGKSDQEIAEIIAQEQRTRAISREEKIHDAMVMSRIDKAMEKYANLSRGKKIMVGLGVTAGVALGGILAGGVTAGVGAAIGVGAAKSAKAYLKRQSDVYTRKSDEDLTTRTAGDARERIAQGHKFEYDARRDETERSDRNKRIAVGLGAAAGALVGTGVVLRTLDTIEWAKNIDRPSLLFPNYTGGEQIDRPDIDAPTGLTPEQDNEINFPGDDTSVDNHHLDRNQEWPGGEDYTETEAEKAAKSQLDYDKSDASGETIDERAGSAPEYSYDPSAAETIEAGEGWNQTFGELGITDPSDKAALLADSDLMHQLQDRGLAYYDEQVGGWGMNMTADGQLPESAIDAIQDRAAELTSQEAVESADITEAFSDAANEISNGEGWNQTFGELGITDPNQQYALLNNYSMMQELKNLGLAYQDANGWKMNMTPTGKMPHEALDIVNKYAQAAGYDLAA